MFGMRSQGGFHKTGTAGLEERNGTGKGEERNRGETGSGERGENVEKKDGNWKKKLEEWGTGREGWAGNIENRQKIS